MTSPQEPTEVARLRLPIGVSGLERLVGALEGTYGKGLTMGQHVDEDGAKWLTLHTAGVGS